MAFVAGKLCPCSWTPAGGSVAVLQVTGHSWKEMVDKIDITHTGSGGVQALLAGILRGTGNVKAFLQTTAPYYGATIGIRAGNLGALAHFITAALFFSVPGLVGSMNSVVEVAGGVAYDFDVELSSESGVYAYPTS